MGAYIKLLEVKLFPIVLAGGNKGVRLVKMHCLVIIFSIGTGFAGQNCVYLINYFTT